MIGAHRHPTLGGHLGEFIPGALRFETCLGLRIFRIEIRRVDFGKDVAFLDLVSVAPVPHLHIARDSRVDRRLVPAHDIARKRNGLGRRHRLGVATATVRTAPLIVFSRSRAASRLLS